MPTFVLSSLDLLPFFHGTLMMEFTDLFHSLPRYFENDLNVMFIYYFVIAFRNLIRKHIFKIIIMRFILRLYVIRGLS